MSDLLIRDIPDEVLKALTELAKAAGHENRMDFVREHLVQLASSPIIKKRYTIKLYGETGQATIRRFGDGPVGGGAKDLSQKEFDAYKKAQFYVERNQVGDREKALQILGEAFQEVSEVAM